LTTTECFDVDRVAIELLPLRRLTSSKAASCLFSSPSAHFFRGHHSDAHPCLQPRSLLLQLKNVRVTAPQRLPSSLSLQPVLQEEPMLFRVSGVRDPPRFGGHVDRLLETRFAASCVAALKQPAYEVYEHRGENQYVHRADAERGVRLGPGAEDKPDDDVHPYSKPQEIGLGSGTDN